MIHAGPGQTRQAIFLAERATAAAATTVFSQGSGSRTIRRLQGAERDHLGQALWATMAGCALGLRSLHDAVQLVCPLVPDGHLRAHISGIGAAWRPWRYIDDRQHVHESKPHRGRPSKKEDRPRAIGRTKGGALPPENWTI